MSRRITVLVVAALAVSSLVWVSGQAGQTFQFVVSATNSAGELVTDLKPEEVVFAEKAGKGTVTKVEPFSLPVKVTIAVDNGEHSALALPNYRNGLKGFVEAFPANTEMTVITAALQPRLVVRPTTDRTQIARRQRVLPEVSALPRARVRTSLNEACSKAPTADADVSTAAYLSQSARRQWPHRARLMRQRHSRGTLSAGALNRTRSHGRADDRCYRHYERPIITAWTLTRCEELPTYAKSRHGIFRAVQAGGIDFPRREPGASIRLVRRAADVRRRTRPGILHESENRASEPLRWDSVQRHDESRVRVIRKRQAEILHRPRRSGCPLELDAVLRHLLQIPKRNLLRELGEELRAERIRGS